MKIVNITVNTSDPNVMVAPVNEVAEKENLNVELHCYNSYDCDDDPLLYKDLVMNTKDADLVIMRCMTDPTKFKKYHRYEEILNECPGLVFIHSGNPDVKFAYRDMFRGTDEQYIALAKYVGFRGAENDKGIVYWLNDYLNGPELEVPEPVVQRTDGIYHPDFDRDISLEDYLKTLDQSRPTVGILFVSSYWIYDNLRHIDYLVHEIEKAGFNTIPVFFSTATSKDESTRGTAAHVETYFMDGDKSRIDAMLMNTPFSQLVNSRETRGVATPDEENFYKTMTDVPVFQVMSLSSPYADFEEIRLGLNKNDVMAQVAWPEMDGQIITVPIANQKDAGMKLKKYLPIEERVEHIIKVLRNWITLRRTPVSERKVAILMWQHRPDSGRIGSAAGLDGVESVNEILKRLAKEGYTLDHVPETGKELVDEILEGVTNDFNWMPSDTVSERAIGLVSKNEYLEHFNSIPEFNRNFMIKNWGDPVGEISTDKGKIVIPGIINGNILIGFQPMRAATEQMDAMYHDPELAVPHQYLEYYRWLRDSFGANAIIHIGTHGTLEWLPGKNVGLSGKCFPDVVQDGMIDIYPYIIDDPGEGIQAKRRAEAVLVGHMCPTMAKSGSYDEIASVEAPLQEYIKLRNSISDDRKYLLLTQIFEAAKEIKILKDLGIDENITLDEFSEHVIDLHDYISDVKNSIVRDGIHVLGRVPENEKLDEFIYTLTRIKNGSVPSLRYATAASIGIDMEYALDNSSELTEKGEVYSIVIDRIDSQIESMLIKFRNCDYDTGKCIHIAEEEGFVSDDVSKVVTYICETLVPNLRRMSDELETIVTALDGRYALPGPSGAPTRGNAHLLPMGRNYFSIDPDIIPSRAAWDTGKRMADQLIDMYVKERGTYPREIAFIIWATDTMKTNGDDVAYILWLMGIRPVWSDSGQVIDLEVVPVEELKRPRIDVTVRITGLFRDAFPNLIELIDEAVGLVSELNESDEENYMLANLRKDIAEELEKGIGIDEARRRNSVRIFGCPPGCYGPGVNKAIESSEWKTVEDLADLYIAWGSYGYGKGVDAVPMKDYFVRRFSQSDITVKNMPDKELDMIDIDDVYGYLGGLNAFTRAYGKKENVMSVVGDSSDPDKVRVRHTDEELKFLFRSKVINPKFINGLKQHGFRGVGEIAKMTEHIFGWDATSDIVDDWMYDDLATKYLLDKDMQEWMKDENPYAMMEIINRLQEAIEREMWDASDEMKEALKELFMDAEERIEEITDR